MMGKSQINQKVCNTWLEKNDSANLMFANISVENSERELCSQHSENQVFVHLS